LNGGMGDVKSPLLNWLDVKRGAKAGFIPAV